MAKTWILDTETKGTGAHIKPLEPARATPDDARELSLVTLERPPRPAREEPQPEPLRLKVVDVLAARTLGEDVDIREAVRLLEDVRSTLDVRVFVRAGADAKWRLIGRDELKTLWGFRGSAPPDPDRAGAAADATGPDSAHEPDRASGPDGANRD
ncbi:MAG TPA: hypothetical protein VHS26_02350 [Solirubrobacteraceae bacterium]|jgi:hypothetical protein|nr:hypothetical protein [Solirubrobacteraceae bacterium]